VDIGDVVGAKAHRQAFITGEPGKAPAWNRNSPWAAVIFPSAGGRRSGPASTAPEVGPVALNTSSRFITILTGRPDFFDSRVATGSR